MSQFTSFAPEQLRRLSIFRDLSGPAHAAIAHSARALELPARAEILAHLEPTQDVYFIFAGRVRVNMVAASGRQITYQLLEAGEMFGELAAIDGLPRSASVYAEDACVLGVIEGPRFVDLVAAHPGLAATVMRRLARLSRALAEKVFEYHTYDVRGRIYSELLRLEAAPGAAPGSIGGTVITARDMASRVGTTRENASRIYSDLRRHGVISRDARTVRVLDPARLRSLLHECEFG